MTEPSTAPGSDTQPTGSRDLRTRLRVVDVALQALRGLTSRKLRTALTALGISIGIASLISIQGITDHGETADHMVGVRLLGHIDGKEIGRAREVRV